MKSRQQKQADLEKGAELLEKSSAVIFIDFSGVKNSEMWNLRSELKRTGNPLFVIKKRLLGLIFRNKELEFGAQEFKTSVGTVFASNLESAAASVCKFFRGLEKEKKIAGQKILDGYDLIAKRPIPAPQIVAIGQLPPREVLLGQLLGIIAAPIRSLLYVLEQKAKQAK